ncbi:MAG: hypothetical protein ACOYOB_08810 [Myxococcota bacterium]
MGILAMRRALAGALAPVITTLTLGRVEVDTSGELGGEDIAQEKRGVAMKPLEDVDPAPSHDADAESPTASAAADAASNQA